ncbi:MAG: hypothetical protein AMS16_01715 [Planctomycetes bacterium DG_58]|nr:MAG: hypothetical protein AMS16_01715 [Planctomycetes bacterium DG_58]KPL02084.1 MAG: hypothetical protein AMK75_03315 [Planctomycetes bacterium SM23_65]
MASADTSDIPTRRLRGDTVLILLVVIILVGAWLRFSGLANQSLWNDELWTWDTASMGTLGEMLTESRLARGEQTHPPLYFILQHFVVRHIGDSETVLRLPSAVAGVLTIAAVYLLGRRLYSDTEGLIAAALMAVVLFPVRYSQEARANSMVLLFALLATYFWVDVLRSLWKRERPRAWPLVAYLLCAMVLAALHYFGLYLVGLQGIATLVICLVGARRSVVWLPLLYLPVVLVYIPWLPPMLRTLRMKRYWAAAPSTDPFFVVFTYMRHLYSRSDAFTWMFLALYAWLVGRALHEWITRRRDPAAEPATPHAGLLLVLWFTVPTVGAYVKSLVSTSVFYERNLSIAFPAGYLLAARAIARLPLRRRYLGVLTAAICVALTGHLMFGLRYYSSPHKDQFREAARFVVDHPEYHSDAMIIGVCYGKRFFDYYFQRFGSSLRTEVHVGKEKTVPKVREAIAQRNPRYIWVLYGNFPPERPLLDYLRAHFRLVTGQQYPIRAGALLFEAPRRTAP